MELSAWSIAGISIFAVFVGATIPVITDVFRVQLERKQRIQDRRDDFQRETLLALQEALIQRGVLGAEIHAMAHAGDPMSQELQTKERMASLEVGKLAARVIDSRTRELTERFQDAVNRARASGPDADDFDVLSKELISALSAVKECIGEQLRKL